jgi:hypothetical protein
MNGDLKLTFQQQVLAQYNQDCIAAMQLMMRRMKIGKTEEGYNSFTYDALMQGSSAISNLTFREYLRFVDMGVGRAHPLGGLTTMKVTLQAQQKEGLAFVKDKGRKPKKFYSKLVYGKLTWLQNKLLYGYTEETIAMLKKNITQDGTNTN